MLDFLWMVPLLPCAGFVLLAVLPMSRTTATWLGVGLVGLATLLTLLISIELLSLPDTERVYTQALWTWFRVADLDIGFTLYLDVLSLVMMCVITGISFLILLYSVGYMADDPGFNRFFAYMNLFVAAMLLLVLGDNMVSLFFGWEVVGLCSYLLIGFWYDDPENGYAARKAFIVTRAGDVSMLLGMFLLFLHLDTLNIQQLMLQANIQWLSGSTLPVVATALLLGGAVGKSAQLPLQIWLPDAMAGPTPISALIHAATMVTAGVYLIARLNGLYLLAPQVLITIAIMGATVLVISGFSALVQTDIKRILAYSTISQLGYMFLALGIGAWSAAIFHLMTHAFFKALLFLASGAVIISVHHEQNIFKMGGLRKRLPLSFWSFLIGGLALSAIPLTSGYFSKDQIIEAAAVFKHGGEWLWLASVVGALLTGSYIFRLIFVVFFGEEQGRGKDQKQDQANSSVQESFGYAIRLPLLVLCALSLFGGWISLPFGQFFPTSQPSHEASVMSWLTTLAPIVGIAIAYVCYYQRNTMFERLNRSRSSQLLNKFWFSGWGFDWLYQKVFIAPYMFVAKINKSDVVDSFYTLLAWLARLFYHTLSLTQSGRTRWYAAIMVLGVVGFLGLSMLGAMQ